jgi:TolB protein
VDINFWDVFSVAADGTDVQRLTDEAYFTDVPTWSPDGTRIAYMRDTDFTENFDVFVMNADGSGKVNITNSSSTNDREPSWSPGGQRIVFSRGPSEGGLHQLYVMRADGTRLRRLTRTSRPHDEPAWSPDGRSIVFSGEGNGLWVTDLRGNEHELTSGNTDYQPEWSPDGQWIAFIRHINTNRSLYVVRPDGTGLTRLTQGPSDTHPAWAPDGTKIAFVRPLDGNEDIFAFDIQTLTITNMTNSEYEREYEIDWQPIPS